MEKQELLNIKEKIENCERVEILKLIIRFCESQLYFLENFKIK